MQWGREKPNNDLARSLFVAALVRMEWRTEEEPFRFREEGRERQVGMDSQVHNWEEGTDWVKYKQSTDYITSELAWIKEF